MVKKIALALGMVLLLAGSSFAVDAKDVTFPETLSLESVDLVFNGAGIRTKKVGFITVEPYVAALFLKERMADAQEVVAADAPMAIRLYITSSLISSKKMSRSTREGFERSTGGKTEAIQKEIDDMISVFKEDINPDDIYDLVYVPGVGTCIYKQGKKKTVVKGHAFKKALFGIWLGEKPTLETMKAGMLGHSG